MAEKVIKFRDEYAEIIGKALREFFFKLIYEPLLKVFDAHSPTKISAADPFEMPLLRKIQDGSIIYDGEFFSGKFDSKSSRIIRQLGGKWYPERRAFKFPPGKLTPNLKTAISASFERVKRIHAGLLNELSKVESRIEPALESFDLSAGLDRVIDSLQEQAVNALDAIGIKYTLTHGMRERLKQDYVNNMKLLIKDWSAEHIKELREKVIANQLAGYRFERLKDILTHEYGVSRSKADFLAYQETSLFTSKFRRERYLDGGVNFYMWSTVRDRKVRPSHRVLDGRIFMFGDPPIVDPATGRRCEPGEDFRCRCQAIPVTKRVHKVGGEWKVID